MSMDSSFGSGSFGLGTNFGGRGHWTGKRVQMHHSNDPSRARRSERKRSKVDCSVMRAKA
jgi:hypothetical protein